MIKIVMMIFRNGIFPVSAKHWVKKEAIKPMFTYQFETSENLYIIGSFSNSREFTVVWLCS